MLRTFGMRLGVLSFDLMIVAELSGLYGFHGGLGRVQAVSRINKGSRSSTEAFVFRRVLWDECLQCPVR
jgi:hypothetical protein